MMWSYVSLPDETQIAYSDIREDGTVLVGIERPSDMGFDSARCVLPSYVWQNVEGFTEQEMTQLDALVRDNAPFIFELAQRDHKTKTVA